MHQVQQQNPQQQMEFTEAMYNEALIWIEDLVHTMCGNGLELEKQLFFLAKMRSEGKIAVAVATSCIAATLLPGGRTAHSTVKLPLKINPEDTPVCNISKGTGTSAVLKECQLIVWDESTMAHSNAGYQG
ncbi:hypothetical protein ACOMHN_062152 [Nucella lapillus]